MKSVICVPEVLTIRLIKINWLHGESLFPLSSLMRNKLMDPTLAPREAKLHSTARLLQYLVIPSMLLATMVYCLHHSSGTSNVDILRFVDSKCGDSRASKPRDDGFIPINTGNGHYVIDSPSIVR